MVRRVRASLFRLLGLFVRGRRERDLAAELDSHLQLHIDDNLRAGMTPDEARRQALIALGGVEQTKERVRDARGTFLDSVRQDVVFALRLMRRSPVVTGVAVLSLALGIGANTAIFSILDSLLLRSLPVREPERLVLLVEGENRTFTNPVWEQVRSRRLFDGEFAWQSRRFDLARTGQREYADGMLASGRMFEVLGIPALLGRTFTEADDRRGGGPDGLVAVISRGLWRRHFGGSADVIGRSLSIDTVPFTIVGVVSSAFFGLDVGRNCDVVVPLGAMDAFTTGRRTSVLDDRGASFLTVMARLAPGQTMEAATASLRRIQPAVRDATALGEAAARWLPPHLRGALTLEPGALGISALRTRYQRPLIVLMAGVALVLLVACANLANLLLARATARHHEISVRRALGASHRRLARQLLTESLLLAASGAAVALLLARWGSELLVRQLSTPNAVVFLALPLDWRALGFTTLIAALTALLFGVAPALWATRVQPHDTLKQDAGSPNARHGAAFGSAMVVMQVALSLVLLVGAGLFVRTFSALVTLNLGVDQDRILMAMMYDESAARQPAQRAATFDRIRDAVAAVPGVGGAALSAFGPVVDGGMRATIEVPDGVQLAERDRRVAVNYVSPRWFATLGTAVVAGRDFTDDDRLGGARVAIVNQTFARRFFANLNPVGRIVRSVARSTAGPPVQIVGLVSDAVYGLPRDPVPPTVYYPLAQAGGAFGYVRLCVRAAGLSPASLVRSVSAASVRVDPTVRLTVRTLGDDLGATVARERLLATLAGFFGLLALLLAALGLYGVTSYAVSRRRTEIGIRMALGAAPACVVRTVLTRVVWLVGLGVIIGAGIGLWAARFVESLLFGVKPRDPLTFAGAAAVLVATGLLAGWLPARRAAWIDPTTVLREN